MVLGTHIVENSYGKQTDWTLSQTGATAYTVTSIMGNGSRCGHSFTAEDEARKYLAAQGKLIAIR